MTNSIAIRASSVEQEVAQHIGSLAIATFTNGLSLTEVKKDGSTKNYSLERGIAFANGDARKSLAASLYSRQMEAGRFYKVLWDALDGNAVTKGQGEAFKALLMATPAGQELPDEVVLQVTGAILTLVSQVTKPINEKSQKAYYISLVREVKQRVENKLAKRKAEAEAKAARKGQAKLESKSADSNVIDNEAQQPAA